MRSWWVHVGSTSAGMDHFKNVISVDIKESHFESQFGDELTKIHIDFSVSSLNSSSRKKHGSRSILDAE